MVEIVDNATYCYILFSFNVAGEPTDELHVFSKRGSETGLG